MAVQGLRALALACCLGFLAPSASASEFRDVDAACREPAQLSALIASCTALIDSGRLSGAALAKALSYRGMAQFDAGGADDAALRDFEQSIAIAPEAVAYAGHALINLYVRRDYPQAINDANRSIELDPAEPFAFRVRGLTYLRLKQQALAVADCRRSVDIAPDFAAGYACLARAHNAADEFDAALDASSRALAIAPDSVSALVERGVAQKGKGNFASAVGDFSRALDLSPDDPDALLERGKAHALNGQVDQALADMTAAIAADESFLEARFVRAGLLYDQLRNAEAAADLDRVLEAMPNDARVLFARAEVHLDMGEIEPGLRALDAALVQEPTLVPALIRRARVRAWQGADDAAVADFDRAVSLADETKITEALGERGVYRASIGALQSAIDDFSAVLAIDPDSVQALLDRGSVLTEADRTTESLADLQRAAALAPDYVEVQLALADLHYKTGGAAASAPFLDRASDMEPDNGFLMFSAGWAHASAGDPGTALAYFDRAAALGFDAPLARVLTFFTLLNQGSVVQALNEILQAPRFDTAPSALISLSVLAIFALLTALMAAGCVAATQALLRREAPDAWSVALGGLAALAGAGLVVGWNPVFDSSESAAGGEIRSAVLGAMIPAVILGPIIRNYASPAVSAWRYVTCFLAFLAIPAAMAFATIDAIKITASASETSTRAVSRDLFRVREPLACAGALTQAFPEARTLRMPNLDTTVSGMEPLTLMWFDSTLGAILLDAPAAFGCGVATLEPNPNSPVATAAMYAYRLFVALILVAAVAHPLTVWRRRRVQGGAPRATPPSHA